MNILFIDDEDLFREEIAEMLREQGHVCYTAANGQEGIEIATRQRPDLVICDIIMPLMNGTEVLQKLRYLLPETNVIMITAHGTTETAIEALRLGACDYILKPIDFEELLQKMHNLSERKALIDEVKNLRREIARDGEASGMIGKSDGMQTIYEWIEKLKTSKSTVLIRGETGTGKGVVARAIHNSSCPPGRNFVAVNCAAIPENLFEAELFGYVRGAFTGAGNDKMGFIEKASQGTLFLDEIGEIPISMQAKLLRVLEEKVVQRVGSTKQVSVDLRFVVATNRDLGEMVKQGKFREDLFYRIRVVEFEIPPLRERRTDIPKLVDYFIQQFNREMKKEIQGVENSTLQSLMLYPWPGNIRELRNAVERAMLFQTQGFLQLKNFPLEISGDVFRREIPDSLEQACKAYERAHIEYILQQVDGNRTQAARRLGIDRSTLYRKLSE